MYCDRQILTGMLRYFIFLLACCFCWTNSPGQKNVIDSLRLSLGNSKQDSNWVNTMNLLTRQVYLTGNYDTALIYANQAKSLGEKIGFEKGVANAYNNIGNVYWSLGKYDSSLNNHQASLKIQTTIGNRIGIASSNNNIGNIYFQEGNYPEALKYYLVAMKTYEELKNTSIPNVKASLASSYNNLGNVNFMESNFDDAIHYYRTSLQIREEIGDKHGAAACYGNIGNIFYSKGNYPEALKNHEASLKIKEEINDQEGIAATYGNIGTVYYSQQQYPEALENFFKSAERSKQLGDKEVLANAYSNIGQVYVIQHKSKEATEYLLMSLALGKETGSREVLKNSYNGLYAADSALGKWEDAYAHHKLFVLYRDSLQNEENTRKIVQSQMNYEFSQKESAMKAEQQKHEDELKREKLVVWLIVCSLLLVLLSLVLFFNRYRLQQKSKYQEQLNIQQKEQAIAVMETQELERKRIAEDLHDSLGHLLSTVKLNLQAFPENDKQRMDNPLLLLNQASAEIRNITFNLMPKTLEEEGLVPALRELTARISASGLVKAFLHVHGMESVQLEKQKQFNIYRIIQEAVNNILKHAAAKEISVQLIRDEKQLTIMIEDDGKGFDAEQTKMKGRGVRNIYTRTAWLKGTVTFDSRPGNGTTIAIQIPV